ncbi:peptidoglycan recognition protein family protein [Xenorhabdus sp. BG5]|uniref:peptidoglycan recognition protein family protein n=1 Tax=Xenorhabdus sp. BG5 TaxID=2782014 RepID=UPI00187FC59D|nr:N-acetylmuramoyl-L-alanine amidase [Xenorhabdus sp. BG5]MBE8598055.1 N-acetylmuramoyl-L-alanine amidase [Xenorhabdus sp. BG5]
MDPINEKEKTLLVALNDDSTCFNKKEELIKELSKHDENNTWNAGKACATCPPPEARNDFVKYVLSKITYVNDDGFFKNSDIIQDRVSELEHGEMSTVNAIVLHRTGGSSMSTAISSFKSTGVGTHFIIDKDGTIKQTASLKQYTYHIGKIKSKCMEENNCNSSEEKKIKGWGWNPKKTHDHEKSKEYPDRYPMNTDSVGIEVVASYNKASKFWDPATTQQKDSIKKLVSLLKCNYNLGEGDIYEHDKISYKTEGEGANLYPNSI